MASLGSHNIQNSGETILKNADVCLFLKNPKIWPHWTHICKQSAGAPFFTRPQRPPEKPSLTQPLAPAWGALGSALESVRRAPGLHPVQTFCDRPIRQPSLEHFS